jgi:formylglycine-generating enzyme required for sulfatase activity
MKTEQNQSIRGFLIFTLFLTLLIGLCLPAAFEAAAQVGVDARDSGKKKEDAKSSNPTKTTKSTKRSSKSAKAKANLNTGILILKTDLACRIMIRSEGLSEINFVGYKDDYVEVSLKAGQHFVLAQSLDGLYNWVEWVHIEKSERLEVNIKLKEKKIAAERKAEDDRKAEEARKDDERKAQDERAAKERDNREIDGLRNSFARIPAGRFLLGSNSGEADERPALIVTISRSFEIGKYEVTQAQWYALMRNNPSHFKAATRPVEKVSWYDIQDFILKMNDMNDAYIYRLPTEAEWEYACRAGSLGEYAGNLNEIAWYKETSGNTTHTVGLGRPNAWGLYDMHGNVWEWCADWYIDYYYSGVDPTGPSSGSKRVMRGGGWDNTASYLRSAYRSANSPGFRYGNLGFRLVRTLR